VALGIAERREAPPSSLFRFVPDHVAAAAVLALSRSRERALEALGHHAAAMRPAPVSVVVFGSLARADADVASDIDVVIVRRHGVADDDTWRATVEAWHGRARSLTGNRVEIVEIAEDDAARRLRRPSGLWSAVANEGITVFGAPIDELRQTARARSTS
jgi:predicted nucleotidyltransferase